MPPDSPSRITPGILYRLVPPLSTILGHAQRDGQAGVARTMHHDWYYLQVVVGLRIW